MIGAAARWKEMERWVPSGETDLVAPHPIVPIGEVIVPRRERIRPDQFGQACPITIHFDGSIERRKRTAPFQGTMYVAYPGDLVFSKIDVRNGAIGILSDDIPKAVVTAEYPVYSHDPAQLDARFFALVVRSPHFLKILKTAATGHSGRKRVSPEVFETLDFPLPEVKEQLRMLAEYQAAMGRVSLLKQKAEEAERNALKQFEASLGLIPPANLPRRLFQVAQFSSIQRWSHEGILDQTLLSSSGSQSDRFPLVTLSDVIEDLCNGWSPQCHDRPALETEWGVLKVGAVSFGWFDESQNKALPLRLKPRPWLEVRPGDLIISRANVLRLVGSCAMVHRTRARLLLCDKLFRVSFSKNSLILPEFLNEILKTPSVRQQIEAAATGTSPTMKNISKPALLGLTFPLPTGPDGLRFQETAIADLETARGEASNLRYEAESLRAAAWSEFLTAVFA